MHLACAGAECANDEHPDAPTAVAGVIVVNNRAAGSHVVPVSCMRLFIDETSVRRGKEASGPWAGPGVNELDKERGHPFIRAGQSAGWCFCTFLGHFVRRAPSYT